MLNLSGSDAVDTLKLTDALAGEALAFPGIAVVPVNLTLAALAAEGMSSVQTPQDAVRLAELLNADATLVAAITDYHPYDPPRIGIVLQLYPTAAARAGDGRHRGLDPVSASRRVGLAAGAGGQRNRELSALRARQFQQAFNAADERVRRDIVAFADRREGHQSPYGWRIYTQSQELFARYCCWAAIRTMITESPEFFALPMDRRRDYQ